MAREYRAFAHGMAILELSARFPEGADIDADWGEVAVDPRQQCEVRGDQGGEEYRGQRAGQGNRRGECRSSGDAPEHADLEGAGAGEVGV